MKILLLGGDGFIGYHIAKTLRFNHSITVFDIANSRCGDILKDITFIKDDIRTTNIESLIQETDLVVDLIAYANPSIYIDQPIEVFELNFIENYKIAQLCSKHGKRLIQFSTCEVYGNHGMNEEPWDEDVTQYILGPVNRHRWIYSCAKQMLERVLHAYGLGDKLDYTIIRPFNFIGPTIDFLPSEQPGCPRVFSHFIDALKTGGTMKLVNGGKQRRAYTYINDAVECITHIIRCPYICNREIINIGSPDNETSIEGLAKLMCEIYKDRQWGETLPDIVSVSGEEFYGKGYDDAIRRIPSIDKAQLMFGWKPTTCLRTTIEKSMEYWFK